MRKLQVFISYARADRDSVALVRKLDRELRGSNLNLLWDERIPEGEWSPRLNEWMRTCHVGIVLLSRAAAVSPNVIHEIHILKSRLEADRKRFSLIPILMPGVSARDLENDHFNATGLATENYFYIEEGSTYLSFVLAQLEVAKFFLTPGSSDEGLACSIANHLLDAYDQHPGIDLEASCRLLGAHVGSLDPRSLSRATAEALLQGEFSDLHSILAAPLQDLSREAKRDLINLISPFIWVPEALALSVASAASAQPPPEIRINGQASDFTPRQVVQRSGYHSPLWLLAIVNGVSGESALPGILNECRKALLFSLNLLSDATDEAIHRALEDRLNLGDLIFLVVPLAYNDNEIIEAISQHYPAAAVIFLINNDDHILLPPASTSRGARIALRMRLQDEQSALLHYWRSMNLAGFHRMQA